MNAGHLRGHRDRSGQHTVRSVASRCRLPPRRVTSKKNEPEAGGRRSVTPASEPVAAGSGALKQGGVATLPNGALMARPECARCGRRASRPVVYGYPSSELMERAKRGEVILGGCLIGRPWLCDQCQRDFPEETLASDSVDPASSITMASPQSPPPRGGPYRILGPIPAPPAQ